MYKTYFGVFLSWLVPYYKLYYLIVHVQGSLAHEIHIYKKDSNINNDGLSYDDMCTNGLAMYVRYWTELQNVSTVDRKVSSKY